MLSPAQLDIMMPRPNHQCMRTTLTLDDDVARKLTEEARRSGKSFKEVVNEHLRAALNAKKAIRRVEPFRVVPKPMGARPGVALDDVGGLLERLEGAAHR